MAGGPGIGAVGLNTTEAARAGRERARLEEAGRPEPLVDADAIHPLIVDAPAMVEGGGVDYSRRGLPAGRESVFG